MGVQSRKTNDLKVNKKQNVHYTYRQNDDGIIEKVEVNEQPNNMADSGWDFESINDDYYNAWNEFEGVKSQINTDNGFESIDINSNGVGIIVESGKNKFRHEVSSEFCSPPCAEFIKTGDCKHIRAMKAHNEALKALQEKIGDSTDPDAAFNRFDTEYANPDNIVLTVDDEEAGL